MSVEARAKALAAAQAASEGITALMAYARDTGPIMVDFEHDAIQSLADATRLALETLSIARDEMDPADDSQLTARGASARLHGELERWIHG